MIRSFKIVWLKIPKKKAASLAIFFGSILVKGLFDRFFSDNSNLFDCSKIVLATGCGVLLIFIYFLVSFIYFSLRTISQLQTQITHPQQNPSINQSVSITKSKKVLPYRQISIGSLKTDKMAVDIQAKIVLEEQVKPDIENFMTRIDLGNPYCPERSRPLDEWKTDWMANFSQIGYKCLNCHTQRKGDGLAVLYDVYALIRSNYDHYWNVYAENVKQMTGGNPSEFSIK